MYLFFVILFIFITGVLYFAIHVFYFSSPNSLDFNYTVKGCASQENIKRSFYSPIHNKEHIKVIAKDNSILYQRSINHLCCKNVSLSYNIKDKTTINIYEIWKGTGCKCLCFSEINATISNLPRGEYHVNLYEINNNKTKKILSTTVSIN